MKGETLQDWVEKGRRLQPGADQPLAEKSAITREDGFIDSFIDRSGIVHRLDKDTSGVMVIAKTPQAFFHLQNQFKQRKVKKSYLALVHGKVEPKQGDIRMPLARKPSDRKKIAVRLGGRQAITYYKVIDYFKIFNKDFSLLELEPKTGRTHQLRVHLKYIGYPIVSDPIYLGSKRLKQDKEIFPRLFLHAKSLSFIHPQTKKKVKFEAKLAHQLAEMIK